MQDAFDTNWDDLVEAPPRKKEWTTWVVILLLLGGAFVTLKQIIGPRLAHAGWTSDFDAAVTLSRQTNKPLLVLFSADWCPACQHLKLNTLSQKDLAGQLESRFTLVKVDLTNRNETANRLATHLKITSLPTLVLFDNKGQVVDRISGSVPAQFLKQWLDARTGRR